MKPWVKYTAIIGGGTLALGTLAYFIFRKPKPTTPGNTNPAPTGPNPPVNKRQYNLSKWGHATVYFDGNSANEAGIFGAVKYYGAGNTNPWGSGILTQGYTMIDPNSKITMKVGNPAGIYEGNVWDGSIGEINRDGKTVYFWRDTKSLYSKI